MTQDPVLGRRVWSDRQLRQRLAEDEARAGAETSSAAPVLHRFPFRFDTPGLVDGVNFYTPTEGEVILNGWFSVLEAWDDGTTHADSGPALADVGNSQASTGWFADHGGGPFPLSADYRGWPGRGNDDHTLIGVDPNLSKPGVCWSSLALMQPNEIGTSPLTSIFPAPWLVAGTEPIQLMVSATGRLSDGEPMGGNAVVGHAAFYLLTIKSDPFE